MKLSINDIMALSRQSKKIHQAIIDVLEVSYYNILGDFANIMDSIQEIHNMADTPFLLASISLWNCLKYMRISIINDSLVRFAMPRGITGPISAQFIPQHDIQECLVALAKCAAVQIILPKNMIIDLHFLNIWSNINMLGLYMVDFHDYSIRDDQKGEFGLSSLGESHLSHIKHLYTNITRPANYGLNIPQLKHYQVDLRGKVPMVWMDTLRTSRPMDYPYEKNITIDIRCFPRVKQVTMAALGQAKVYPHKVVTASKINILTIRCGLAYRKNRPGFSLHGFLGRFGANYRNVKYIKLEATNCEIYYDVEQRQITGINDINDKDLAKISPEYGVTAIRSRRPVNGVVVVSSYNQCHDTSQLLRPSINI